MRHAPALALLLLLLPPAALAASSGGALPSRTYTPDLLGQLISPQLGAEPHNQPAVVNGHLLLAGNASHQLWDIADPFAPVQRSAFVSPHAAGEAESHTVTFLKTADGRHLAATISGRGVDLWDLTDARAPTLLSSLELDGIDYGDNTHAVWGVFWQGDILYVGGTNTGLHVVDTSDPTAPELVVRVPTTELGGVSAGPLFALGNLLIITTPKDQAGIATVDISDPRAPALLDFVLPEVDSYIGWVYGTHAYLLTPFRTYDVTSDPTDIRLVGSATSPPSEYVSFGDDTLFLGSLRPEGGQFKVPLPGPEDTVLDTSFFIEGRRDPDNLITSIFSDDQFSLPIGNLLVISDDELKLGSVLAVHATQRDSVPPRVAYTNPPDGASGQALTTRVGLSLTDQIDLRSVDSDSFILRPVGGEALTGSFGHAHTLLSFWPAAPLLPDTTYEIVLPAGGISDLAGNTLATEVVSVFSTGADVSAPTCAIQATLPAVLGSPAALSAASAGADATYGWDFGDGATDSGAEAATSHAYTAPGRYRVRLQVAVGGVTRTCSAIQVAHPPLAAARPTASGPVAVDTARGRAWVSNPDAGTVSAVGLDDLLVQHEVVVGAHPDALALGAGGGLWVAVRDADTLVELDADTGEVTRTITLDHGAAPAALALSPNGQRLFVALDGPGRVLSFDLTTAQQVATFEAPADATGLRPRLTALALSPDGLTLLAPRLNSARDRGLIFQLSAADLTLQRTLELGADPGPDASDAGRGVPNMLSAIVIDPSGQRAWVPAKKDNTGRGLASDGLALSTTNTVRTMVTALDLGAGAEVAGARVDLDDHSGASAVALSPTGDLVFVATMGTNAVDVLDAWSGRLVAGFATGLAPDGLALTGEGLLLVRSRLSRTLSVYDVSGLLAGTDGAAAHLAEVPTVATEPLSAEVLLGKQVFHNADSRQMSQDGYIACATCHLGGADDGRVWDFTDRGEGLRNTIDLRGRAGTAHGLLHWTGNFDEVQDFENDIRAHFGGSGLMADADFEADDRSDSLGAPKAGFSPPLDALAAYVTSLDTFPNSPHRNPDGSRTEAAQAGERLFRSLNCLDCHNTQALTDSATGTRHDVGTITAASGQRRGEPLDGLDTPTLRGLWATPPYLHDGSAPTLADVLANPTHTARATELSPDERAQLIAFLNQLENEPIDLSPLPPWEPTEPPTTNPEPGSSGGCQSTPTPPNPILALLLLALTTRRRSPAQGSNLRISHFLSA